MTKTSNSKSLRVLSMFERLKKGKIINRNDEATRFGVSLKTIQRDIEELRVYYSSFQPEENVEITYESSKEGYILKRNNTEWLNCQEILGLSKILLESRGFSEEETDQLLSKLIKLTSPQNRKHIEDVIANERFHYIPLNHDKNLMEMIWDMSIAIKESRLLEVVYKRNNAQKITRILEPLGVMFDEYYFYLIAHQKNQTDDYKIPYRLDRIIDYSIKDEHFKISYKDRFKEGEFRKRVQFMTPGSLMKIKFKFWGRSIEAVLDRLPTAEIIKQNGDTYVIQAEVFGQGIKMWLLSQGQYLEVLEPASFRSEMAKTIKEMASNY